VSTPASQVGLDVVLGPGPQLTSRRRGSLKAFRNVYFLIFALLVVVAIFAPLLDPYDPVRANLNERLLSPSWHHLFGTDSNGMDVFSRVLSATRTDFSVALIGVGISVVLGAPLGAASGYFGGLVGEGISRVAEMIQSIPLFLFALMVFAALGNSKALLVGMIAFVTTPQFVKLTRAVVLPLRSADFVAAARCAGLRSGAILARHVLPNSLGPIASQLSISCAYAIQIVAGLSFLGLGVTIPDPEWGSMIQQGAQYVIFGQWWVSVFPGLAVLVSVIAFGGLGRRLSGWYER
jgi:peptide/nickel transport system permease protein